MRRNKLYTVNHWNKPSFMPERNIFWPGGSFDLTSEANNYFDGSSAKRTFDMNLGTSKEQQYLQSKNAFGISKAANPFSKANLAGVGKAAGTAALSAGAGLLGGIASSAISGGLQSGAGSAISGLGSTVGGAIGTVNPVVGAAVSVGSQLLGGLANRAFGSKLNEENINQINNENVAINQSGAAIGNSTTNEDVLNSAGNLSMGTDFDQDFIGEDGWFSSKAKDKYNELKKEQLLARKYAANALLTGAQNADTTMDDNVMANFSALGGPLFAFGGELGTNGTDWTNGLLYIDNGGKHEDNPLEGVPMGFDPEGVPNLVEEGETIWNDYVFSDRIKVPKKLMKELGLGGSIGKDITFAEASKKLGKESEQRPNDTISIDGLNAAMSRLAEAQEAERMKQQMREYVGLAGYACGGKMNKYDGTNPKGQKMKKGNTGLNTYKFDPIDQFKYWDKEAGDYDAGYRDFIENQLNNDWINRVMSGQYGDMSRYRGANNINPTVEQAWQLGLDKKNSDWHKAMANAYDDYLAGIDPKTGLALSQAAPEEEFLEDPYTEGWEARRGISTEPIGLQAAQEGSKTKVGDINPKTYYTGLRYAPAIGAGVMTLTDALGLTNKPDYTYADKLEAAAEQAGYTPNIDFKPNGDYITYRPMDIWYEQNRLNANARATDRAILNSGATQGAKMAGLIANGYNDQLASGNLYRQALEYNDAKRKEVADFNRRTNMFNSQMGLEAAMANAKYQQQARQMGLSGLAQAAALRDSIDARVGAARAANLSNFLNSLGDIGRENFAMNQINTDRSRRYYGNLSGKSGYKTGEEDRAYGGRIKRRKK